MNKIKLLKISLISTIKISEYIYIYIYKITKLLSKLTHLDHNYKKKKKLKPPK